jgi:hypothetical protein
MVPGLPHLGKHASAGINSLSCASPGNCTAAGFFDTRDGVRVFVVTEVGGRWRPATPLRGIPYGFFGGAVLEAISCPSQGNCSAVGGAGVGAAHPEGFAVTEVNGAWRSATLVHDVAELSLVSCPRPGNCTAAGYHTGRGSGPYMVSEVRGTWGRAAPWPRAPLLYHHSIGFEPVQSLSCASSGNCAAAGVYEDRSLHWQPYVVNQVNGVWQAPAQVPGMAALGSAPPGQGGGVVSISCASPGNCSAGGSYLTPPWTQRPFLVSEVNGIWQPAMPVPGVPARPPRAALSTRFPPSPSVTSVSCPSAGNCTAVGTAAGFGAWGFAVRQVHGTWGRATALSAPAAPPEHRWVMQTVLVSCASPGNCAAGGFYSDPYYSKAYVITERNGIWATATEDPSTLPFTHYDQAQITALSCAPPAGCVAAGTYGTGVIPGQQDTQSTRPFLLSIG